MNTNRDVMETWFDRVWAQEDTTAIDELFVPDGRALGLGANVMIGPDGFKPFHTALLILLSDVVITIDKSIESGEWLSAVCTVQATDRKSAAPVTFTGSLTVKIADGKILEVYNHWDFMSLFGQLGLLPTGTFERALSGESLARD